MASRMLAAAMVLASRLTNYNVVIKTLFSRLLHSYFDCVDADPRTLAYKAGTLEHFSCYRYYSSRT
jgi:hypothetical protein